ncbi:TPR-like protein [Pleurotus eryngii]|uniref:TPR-like protein n=1 Tax=Pleurotus eryngii TaxID=5323 RepID=A0A9P5ZNG2_PLEER|nr:TPR-like protein [Pleurotus eryngii]
MPMPTTKLTATKAAKKLNPAGAEKLKAQGNALFAQRKWAGAHAKCSEATEQDDTNPVYWADRAACNLETKDYLEACTDAGTAIDLDPTYAKAWGRLGAAQRAVANYEGSISAYKKALEALPSGDNMTPADKKLEEQFTNALELVLEEQKNSPRKSNAVMIGAEKATDLDDALPWNRAENTAEELHEAENRDSMVDSWCIRELKEGVAIMNLLTSATTDNQRATTGGKNALAHIVGGLIRDQRTFFERFPLQVRLELNAKKAWDCSTAVVKKERKERLETQSWNVVCESLYTTIWVWILRSARKREFSKAAEYYTKSAESFPEDDEKRVYSPTLALEALWGREAPVKETLPVVEKAKKSIPKMKKIWEHSAMSKRRDASITLMLQFEKQVRKALKSGRMTIDGVAKRQMP